MDTAAFQHRPDSEDCYLYEPDQLVLRLHTAKDDAVKVTLLYGDPYMVASAASGEAVWQYRTRRMAKIGTGQAADYWATTVTMPYQRLQYQFLIEGPGGCRVLFGDGGVRSDNAANRGQSAFRFPYFHEADRVKPPRWATETVWYQIFPERFANGDWRNDPVGTKPWRPSDHPGRSDFYGGDLQGVLDHLDDLQALGVTGLYFCPLFKAPSNHKYDTSDYFTVDPAFGDQALLTALIASVHQRGMKVMLDAVFNHIGDQSPQFQDVLKNGTASQYADWFYLHDEPLIPFHDPLQGQGAPQYETFAFAASLPKLNTSNPAVQAYLLKVATYWTAALDIDAWRLDAAGEVDHRFWRRFALAVHAVKPALLIIGEVWHSGQPWLTGDQFDGVTNYAYTEQIAAHFFTRQLTAQALVGVLVDQLMKYRWQTDQVMLNALDSHDTPRLLTQAQGSRPQALQALAFMFCQPGMPCLYYGTEMGMTGGNDPDCRKPMAWEALRGPMWRRVHTLVAFRRSHAALLSRGRIQMTVTAAGLIKVVRGRHDELAAYFNTTAKAVSLQGVATVSQGFRDGRLAPTGFVLMLAESSKGGNWG